MNKETIPQALKTVINKQTSLAILEYVCLSDNYLSVTDLETYLSIPYKSGVNTCVHIEQFLSAIDMMENPSFKVTESKDPQDQDKVTIEISSNERKIKVTGEDPMNFPNSLIELSDAPDFFHVGHIDSEELQYMEKALEFTSNDKLERPAMTGVYIGEHVVATDAHRLYWKALKNMDEEFILPKKTIKTMLVFGGSWDVYCGINYYMDEKNKQSKPEIKHKWGAFVNDQGVLITFTPIDAKFLDYKAFISSTKHEAYSEIVHIMKAFNFEISTSTPGNSCVDREEINVFANTIDEAWKILETVPNRENPYYDREMEFNGETELDELQTKLHAEGKKYEIVLNQLITVSLGLYHSTKDNQYYVQIITAPKEEHLFFLVSKAKAREISEIGRVDIVPTEESFI